ncbi:MAG: regulator SirB, partial [Phototrophicales bacterium]
MYLVFKYAHMLFAVVSFSLFVVRGFWMITESSQLQQRWVKIVPHVNDALLLSCAIALMLILHQYPGTHHWLTAKVLALLLYIGLGTIALKRGKTRRVRVGAFI